MKIKRVSKKSSQYKAIKQLYLQSFPFQERAPFWVLMRKAKQPRADFWALYEKEQWVGIAYIIKDKKLVYIFYLTILPEHQGKGYGKKAMKLLKSYYKDSRIFLAIETLDKEAYNYQQRMKRHSFYKKCGLRDLPYKIKEASVIYNIMGIGGSVKPKEYRKMMEDYLGKFLCNIVDIRMIPDKV